MKKRLIPLVLALLMLCSVALASEYTPLDEKLKLQVRNGSGLTATLSFEASYGAQMSAVDTATNAMLGALLLVPLDQFIRAFFGGKVHGLNLIIYAVILILVILTIPQGIWPTIESWFKKIDRKALSKLPKNQAQKPGSEVR